MKESELLPPNNIMLELFEELTPIVERAFELFAKEYYGVQQLEVRSDSNTFLWANKFRKAGDDSVGVTFREDPDRFTVTISWFPNASRRDFKSKSVTHTTYGKTRDHLETCFIKAAQKRGLKVL